MNYKKACEILDINEKHLDEDVKKAYFRSKWQADAARVAI